jgi:hypothetical protein
MTQKYEEMVISSKKRSIVKRSPARKTPKTAESVKSVEMSKLPALPSFFMYSGVYMETAHHRNAARNTNTQDKISA